MCTTKWILFQRRGSCCWRSPAAAGSGRHGYCLDCELTRKRWVLVANALSASSDPPLRLCDKLNSFLVRRPDVGAGYRRVIYSQPECRAGSAEFICINESELCSSARVQADTRAYYFTSACA